MLPSVRSGTASALATLLLDEVELDEVEVFTGAYCKDEKRQEGIEPTSGTARATGGRPIAHNAEVKVAP
jgi:hypothetical protein